MAAPQIPNLNTFRNARGTGRGRGGGQGGPYGRKYELKEEVHDRNVQQTDQDASVSRLSAVEVGYLDDPFAKYFVSGGGQRRFPIINRGTYVRTKAIDSLVEQFIDKDPTRRKQIISLGAGSDTRFFRLMSRHPRESGIGYDRPNLLYHEIDFSENTVHKIKSIQSTSELCRHLEPASMLLSNSNPRDFPTPEDTMQAQNYHVHPVDLRTLDPLRAPPSSFRLFDTALPTLIISECCLVYLAPAAADSVARYFTQHLFPATTPLGLVLYEPINPDDAFGKVMVSNLAARGIVLQTLRKYGTLEAQAARMNAYGFEGSGGADVNTWWERGVVEKEKDRVAGLEMVDEVEEWELLAGHYCVCFGWRGDGCWDGWNEKAEQMKSEN